MVFYLVLSVQADQPASYLLVFSLPFLSLLGLGILVGLILLVGDKPRLAFGGLVLLLAVMVVSGWQILSEFVRAASA